MRGKAGETWPGGVTGELRAFSSDISNARYDMVIPGILLCGPGQVCTHTWSLQARTLGLPALTQGNLLSPLLEVIGHCLLAFAIPAHSLHAHRHVA